MSFIDSALTAADSILGDSEIPYALIANASRYIGTIIPDVTIREVHTDEDTITQHPVETGSPIADHVFANPKIIEIEFGFSDSTAGYVGYVQDMYQAILALKATRDVFNVSTGKRFYSNMLFGNITVETDAKSEYALMVICRLQEVIITDTGDTSGLMTTQANQADPAAAAPTSNVGNQTLQTSPGASSFDATQAQYQPIT